MQICIESGDTRNCPEGCRVAGPKVDGARRACIVESTAVPWCESPAKLNEQIINNSTEESMKSQIV